jgi:hypothetical protein
MMRIVKSCRFSTSYVLEIIHPCTHFYFSLPTEKFLRGQGEKRSDASAMDMTGLTAEEIKLLKAEM